MAVVFGLLGLAFVTHIWLCIRVGRSSTALAVTTFFFGPIAALYTLFRHRGEEKTSITAAFMANLVFGAAFLISVWLILMPLLAAQESRLAAPMAALIASSRPVAPVAPETPVAPPVAGDAAPISSTVESAASATSSVARAADEIDGFSEALGAGGLGHTVTRLPASSNLPAGVTDAALFSIVPLSSAGATTAAARADASATAGSASIADVSATLFKCESAQACRNLAGAYLRQRDADNRRVLQNGLLLLSLPQADAAGADLTPTAVASVFKRL